jgi:hypothetical protein
LVEDNAKTSVGEICTPSAEAPVEPTPDSENHILVSELFLNVESLSDASSESEVTTVSVDQVQPIEPSSMELSALLGRADAERLNSSAERTAWTVEAAEAADVRPSLESYTAADVTADGEEKTTDASDWPDQSSNPTVGAVKSTDVRPSLEEVPLKGDVAAGEKELIQKSSNSKGCTRIDSLLRVTRIVFFKIALLLAFSFLAYWWHRKQAAAAAEAAEVKSTAAAEASAATRLQQVKFPWWFGGK